MFQFLIGFFLGSTLSGENKPLEDKRTKEQKEKDDKTANFFILWLSIHIVGIVILYFTFVLLGWNDYINIAISEFLHTISSSRDGMLVQTVRELFVGVGICLAYIFIYFILLPLFVVCISPFLRKFKFYQRYENYKKEVAVRTCKKDN